LFGNSRTVEKRRLGSASWACSGRYLTLSKARMGLITETYAFTNGLGHVVVESAVGFPLVFELEEPDFADFP
jgi:hypothetical protein